MWKSAYVGVYQLLNIEFVKQRPRKFRLLIKSPVLTFQLESHIAIFLISIPLRRRC